MNGSLNELCKLPALFTHYLEHHNADNSIDLIDFLAMHYAGDDLNDTDNDQDMQLPFKKVDADTSFHIVFVPAAKSTFEKKQVFPPKKISLPDPQDFNLTHPTLENLFRPPIA